MGSELGGFWYTSSDVRRERERGFPQAERERKLLRERQRLKWCESELHRPSAINRVLPLLGGSFCCGETFL